MSWWRTPTDTAAAAALAAMRSCADQEIRDLRTALAAAIVERDEARQKGAAWADDAMHARAEIDHLRVTLDEARRERDAEREFHAQLQARCFGYGGTGQNVFDDLAAAIERERELRGALRELVRLRVVSQGLPQGAITRIRVTESYQDVNASEHFKTMTDPERERLAKRLPEIAEKALPRWAKSARADLLAAADALAAIDGQPAQPVAQEPAHAWICTHKSGRVLHFGTILGWQLDIVSGDQPYAASSPWIALTDEDRERAMQSMPDMLDGFLKTWGWLHFANAIEAICREKNAAAHHSADDVS